MSKYILILFLFFCVCSISIAQTGPRCGSEEYLEHLKTTQPETYKQIRAFQQRLNVQPRQNLRTASITDTIIKIPVVVHIIHNNTTGAIGGANNINISDAQILSQIDVLNNDYQRKNADSVNTPIGYKPIAANINLEFCLANKDPNGVFTIGITRNYNNKTSYSIADFNTLSSIAYWPSNQYLNIWVCDITGGVLGFAQPPGATGIPGLNPSDGTPTTDGVVIDYKAFGTTGTLLPKFSLGRTATHEVGHWFGLSHPWGNYNSGDCSLTDYCDDTPTCANPFESSFPTCSTIPTGNGTVICTPSRMIQNYMEYSDDGCMNLFTQDQKTRMRSTIELSARRNDLLSSLGCCIINTSIIATPYKKSFEDADITSDGWKTINPNSSSTYTKGFELSHTSAFNEGDYAISVTNDSLYISTDISTHKYRYSYVSPYLNITTTRTPKLRFDWAYSPINKNSTTDSIVIYVSEGCAENWIPLQVFYGTEFSSTRNYRGLFIPNGNEWNTTEIDLSAHLNSPALRIKFISYSKGINTFYVDNINIAASSPNLLVSIYPNPTSDIINIETIFNGKQTLDYFIYNVLGQSVYKTHDRDVYSYTKQIDLSSLAGGVYLVQISDGNNKIIRKIIKQ